MKKELSIEGMMCQNCVKHVTNALAEIKGVFDVSVNLEQKTATIQVDKSVSDDILKAAIAEAGYEVVEIK